MFVLCLSLTTERDGVFFLFFVFGFFQCLLFSEKTRENLGKLILNHGVFVFLFLFHWG